MSDFQVDIVKIPDNMDPDEYLQASEEALGKLLVESRISDVEFGLANLNLLMWIIFKQRFLMLSRLLKIGMSPSVTAKNSYISKVADLLPDFDFFQVGARVNNERLTLRNQQTANHRLPGNSSYESSASGF